MPERGLVGAGDGAQRRGLAGAVAAQQRHDAALGHVEAHALDDVALAIVGVHIAAGEEGLIQARSRGRGVLCGSAHSFGPPPR